MKIPHLVLLAGSTALVVCACDVQKSSNPLSPTVAGPIAGVTITAPKPLEPAAGWAVDSTTQPISLLVENSATSGQRPLSYGFEISVDVGFTSTVFSREGVAPGTNGRTSLKLADSLTPGRTYYWRARAQDGANTGPYTAAVNFTVFTPISLEAPTLVSPVDGAHTPGTNPTFTFRNATHSGPAGTVFYTVQVASSETFASVNGQFDVQEQAAQTSRILGSDLAAGTRYYWRVRAWETARNTIGPWSALGWFVTASASPTPTPTPTPTPKPGSWPTNGPDLVNYITTTYPDRLAAGVSSSQRTSNLEFLRDRTIEAGICGGMQLGWNLKRGGPEKSLDYITYFKGGRWIGVDIAFDSDNTSTTLRMQWGEAANDPYTTHQDYGPMPSCK